MDRPEPGLIKWSPLAGHNRFIHINLQHRVVQLYEPNGVAQQGRFDYKQISKHDDFPALTTYDWSPSFPGLLAVGGQNGGVNLLRMDDNSSDYIELGLKMTRMCQAVAFNTQGILAVGLERVRMDQSLHIWDLNRLSMDKVAKGFAKDMAPFTEPVTRLEHSASISSIKFFEDNPQTLVIGLKSQGLRAGLKLVSGMAFAGRPTASRLSRSFSNAAGPSSMSFSMTCHIGGLSSGFSLKTGFGTPGALAFSDSVGFASPSSLVFGHRLM
ncbi:hypothetical protein BN1723_011378 [Verticillium longisporum]|uniref:Anaphase-promoting complex subunit 4 WD40 domain-containing protein n=1 Tax=Verticillium longisporum TaxID=100787 RepID=A0A0G4L6Q5_VERLO|nr:hypothetical protein BN1723_011378 [Verticillium longisporum]